MTQDQKDRIEYIIKHDPVFYVLKYKFPFYRIENLKGFTVEVFMFFNKDLAEARCKFYNAVYSLGYSCGVTNILRQWIEISEGKSLE